MDIVPRYGSDRISSELVSVKVNPEDRNRIRALVERSRSLVLGIRDASGFAVAKQAAGQLKSILNEITAARKAAKAPFDAVIDAIGEQAKELTEFVEAEHKRVLGLLSAYVTQLEAERQEAERKRQEALRREREEYDRKIREAQEAQARAEEAARMAKDEVAREKARADAQAQALQARQEQIAQEMAAELAEVGAEQRLKGLVSGGRVDHRFEFKLVSLRELINSGQLGLLKYEIDHYACQDACRRQLEAFPDSEPKLPGIQVTRKISVSVKPR